MSIDWIAIAAAIGPYLKKYVESKATKLVDITVAQTRRRLLANQKISKVNELFVIRITKELDSAIELSTLLASSYQEDLKRFLKNDSVQDLLIRPLDGTSELSSEVLHGIWNELDLTPMPVDFDWSRVAKAFKQSIQAHMIADNELRPVLSVAANIRSADANEKTAATLERMAGFKHELDLDRYAEAVRMTYGHLNFGSLDPDWHRYDRGIRLENVYVAQSVKQALPPKNFTRDYLTHLKESSRQIPLYLENETERGRFKEEYAKVQSRPVLDVLREATSTRVVVLGDPGLGKSTLLRWLCLQWSQSTDAPVTVLVELRKVRLNNSLDIFLSHLECGVDPICCLPKVELHQYLKDHNSTVLFDGLDEVTELHRSGIVSQIIKFAAEYPLARIVVTTRVYGYFPGSSHPENFRNARFEHFTLQDFNESDIDSFVTAWHQEAFLAQDERNRYETRLRNAIRDSESISELAANPLLLTMMAILSRTQDLPRDRGKLYESCAELLLRNWDLEKFPQLKDRSGVRDIKDKLGPDQKMRILELVAATMQEERGGLEANLISEDSLKKIIERELVILEVAQPWAVADDLIWMLQERNFMIAHMGDRQYAFVHRTFLEYFCARKLKHQLEQTSQFTEEHLYGIFRSRWQDDAWREVLRLLCGLVGVEYGGKSIDELLNQAQQPDGHEAVLLAAECLLEIRERGQIAATRERLRSALLNLTQFDLPFFYESWSAAEKEEVATVRARAVKLIARNWREQFSTFTFLSEVANESLTGAFFDYFVEDLNIASRCTALEELLLNWRDRDETLTVLEVCCENDSSPEVEAAAVTMLARHQNKQRGTLTWLMRQARRNFWLVRETALREIAHGWSQRPRVQGWLAACITHGRDAVVRSRSIEILSAVLPNDENTTELIKQQFAREPEARVRATALQELSKRIDREQKFESVLRTYSIEHPDKEVREVAIKEVVRRNDGTGIIGWLKEVVKQEVNSDVRIAAIREIARQGSQRPESIEWLKLRFREEPSNEVRVAMIEEVARLGKGDSDLCSWMKDQGEKDMSEDVRSRCIIELMWSFNSDSTLFDWIADQIQRESSESVKEEAVQALGAFSFKDVERTFSWLMRIARDSDSERLRASAAQAPARSWYRDAEVWEFFRTKALTDSSSLCRAVAVRAISRGCKVSVRANFQLPTKLAEHETQFDVHEAGQSSPDHGISWRGITGTGKIAT